MILSASLSFENNEIYATEKVLHKYSGGNPNEFHRLVEGLGLVVQIKAISRASLDFTASQYPVKYSPVTMTY